MKKSRRPKRKEDQKSKTKKARKKAGQANKKAVDDSNIANAGPGEDDGRLHNSINVPPPPRFSEVSLQKYDLRPPFEATLCSREDSYLHYNMMLITQQVTLSTKEYI